jgi:tetratricopeptide (TPR) repeat protein
MVKWLPARFWRLLGRGARLLRRHRLAARAYGVAAHVAPQRAVHHHDLGTVLATLKRHQAAIQAFRRALLLDPNLGRSQRALGRMHRSLGQHAESARAFARAVEMLPEDARLFHELGASLTHLGRHDGAAQAFADAVRLRPGQVGWHRALGRALRACDQHEEAAAALGQVCLLQPDDVQAHFEHAREWLACGHFQRAQKALEKALALQPEHADSALAWRVCQQALTQPPLDVWLQTRLQASQAARLRVGCVLGGGLGNMVQCSPAIRHLSNSLGQPIDVLLNEDSPGCAHLFSGAAWVANVFAPMAEAQAVHYDLLVFLDPFSHRLPAFLAERIAVPRLGLPLSAMQYVHEAEYYLKGLEQTLGIAYRPCDVARYFVGGYRRQPGFPRRVGLHAGCKGGRWRAKRWPYFVELAQRLTAAGLEVVSFGGPDEAVPGTLDCTGLPLNASIEAIATCAYFVSNDSGLMHIADALGIPLTVIFAPSSVVKNGPLAASSQVVELHKACAPCQFDTARLKGCTCIKEISLETVWGKVIHHLRSLPAMGELSGVTPPVPIVLRVPVEAQPYSTHHLQQLLAAQAWQDARALLCSTLDSLPAMQQLGVDAFEHLLHFTWVLAAQPQLAAAAFPLIKTYPVSVLAVCECAATELVPDALDALLLDCLPTILAARESAAVPGLLTAACRYAGVPTLVELLHRIDASARFNLLQRPAVAREIGEVLLGSAVDFHLPNSGWRASDLREQAPLERLIEYALLGQDRVAFIHHVNTYLAEQRGAEPLVRLLKNHTGTTAQLGLTAGEIHYGAFDAHQDNLLLAIHLHDHAMVEHCTRHCLPSATAAMLWRSRQHDYGPLNAALARALAIAGAAPVTFAGNDRLSVFRHCLAGPPLPPAKSRGRVTVILCVHAPDPELLRLAVASVLRQTFGELELILVDDGNPPEPAALIASFAGPRVRVLRSPQNIGVYACRNLGIAAAQGEFISFHDADDIAHPQRIELQLAALLHTPGCQLCYASHIRFDEAGGLQLEVNPDRLNLLGDGPVTALLRRSTFAALGPLANVRTRGDIELRQRIQKCYGPEAVLQLDVPLLYCAGGASTLSNRSMARHRQQIRLLRKAFQLRAWSTVLTEPPLGELAVPHGLRGGSAQANTADLPAAALTRNSAPDGHRS